MINVSAEGGSAAVSLAVPAIIANAGHRSVAEYLAFLSNPNWKPSTRKNYECALSRYFDWAAERHLTLSSITADDIGDYVQEIAVTMSAQAPSSYLTPVRGLFRHLSTCGVLTSNPIEFLKPRKQAGRTLAELKQCVLEIGKEDGWEEGCEDFQAGLVLLAEFSIGTRDPEAISRFTGVPLPLAREFSERLIGNGIWLPDGKIAAEWDDPEHGALAFMADVWVALGLLERGKPAEDNSAELAAEPVPEETAGSAKQAGPHER